MEVAFLAPLACTALDTALDASGGAMPVLATGSGQKLRKALARSFKPQGFSPAQPGFACHRPALKSWNACTPLQSSFTQPVLSRQFGSLVPFASLASADLSRPHWARPSSVPNPRSQESCSTGKATWLCDPSNLLLHENAASLEAALERVNSATGIQFATVILNDVSGAEDIARFKWFGVKLFNHWGVGSADFNNGVLLLHFKDAKRLEILTGTGMTSVLSDSWLLNMQVTHMVPLFKACNHGRGLEVGILAIEDHLRANAPECWRSGGRVGNCDGHDESNGAASFGGGRKFQLAPKSMQPIQDAHHGSCAHDETSMSKILSLLAVGLGFTGKLLDGTTEVELRRLETCVAELEGKPTFQSAGGTTHEWPYMAHPTHMDGLVDTSQTDSQHAFNLVKDILLQIDALGTKFGNSSLKLKLINKSSDPLSVHLQAGSLFVCEDLRGQPLLLQDPLQEVLAPGEERTLHLNTFCGDSGARVPQNVSMVLSPYSLSAEHLVTQPAVWRWAAKHQRLRSMTENQQTCSSAIDILEESFGMTSAEVHYLMHDVLRLVADGETQRRQELLNVKRDLASKRAEVQRSCERARETGSSRGGGGGGFGGGYSCGGGAGCSW